MDTDDLVLAGVPVASAVPDVHLVSSPVGRADTATMPEPPTPEPATPEPATPEPAAGQMQPLVLAMGRGSQVLVVSDLHLRALSDDDSESITSDLARRIESSVGPGAIIFAGDTFELVEEPKNSPQRALTAHPRLADALRRFVTEPDRQLVVLAGESDARLAANESDGRELGALGASVGTACDLAIDTGAGFEKIRVEHGHHVLDGERHERATNEAAEAVEQSRRFYARLRRIWWIPLVTPMLVLLVGVIVRVSLAGPNDAIHDISPLRWLYFVCSMISAQVLLGGLTLALLTLRGNRRVAIEDDPNASSRAVGAQLSDSGFDGSIGTGSHRPELVDLGGSWYANSGCALHRLTRREARFGLPAVFAPSNELSWLEIEAGATLHVTLVASRRDELPGSLIERLVSKSRIDIPPVPTPVATLGAATVWPTPPPPGRRTDRTRRRGALGMLAVGAVDVISALTPPLRGRLQVVRRIIPMGTPSVAAGLVVAAGLGLLMLAAGLRRGRKLAWQLGMVLLVVSGIGNLLKGFDVEETLLAVLFAVWLGAHRASFTAPSDNGPFRRAAIAAGVGVASVGLAATGWIWIGGHRSLGRSFKMAFGRMTGLSTAPLPRHEKLLSSTLPAVMVTGVLVVGWYLLRSRRAPADDDATVARTWELVRRHGRGTLDYFALRDDKRHFISGDTVIAYTVANATAVVSPDPVGPADQRHRAWSDFRRFATTNGWHVAVLAAGAGWLPVYRASGMWAMYIGDESIVDVQRFSLDGGRNKSLRKAVNRVAKAGYTIEFHDPAKIPAELADQLRRLATQSRQGSVERGYSMTLSRLFDQRDQGLLLALARDVDGTPAAFCQFVPAPGIDGYSLDLMRRGDAARADGAGAKGTSESDGTRATQHPNGLTEFVIARTIEHLRATGRHGLGLHFATMRAVLAGQTGSRVWHRTLAEVMHRMSDDMQIESLWRFNSKFDPTWLPRYVVLDTPASTIFAGLAIAKVESLWELPFIGRFMKPAADAFVSTDSRAD